MKIYCLTVLLILMTVCCSKDDLTEDSISVPDNGTEVINLAPNNFNLNVADVSHNRARIFWDKSIDPENDIVKYAIYLNDVLISEDIAELDYNLSNLTESTNYIAKVIAKDESGSETFKTISFTTTKYYLKYFKTYNFGPADYGIGFAVGYVYSIIKTADNNFVMAGKSSRPNGNAYQFIVLKIDKEGNEIWKKFYDYDVGDASNFRIIESITGLILVGRHEILSIDNMGNLLWHKKINSFDTFYPSSQIRSLVQDVQGNIYIVGSKEFVSDEAVEEAKLMKLDNLGNIIWEKTFKPSVRNIFVDIKITSSNELIILGTKETSGLTYYDITHGKSESMDFWVVKTDKEGNIIWDKNYGDGRHDFPRQIITNRNGNYVFAGYSWGAYDMSTGRIFEIDNNGNKLLEFNPINSYSITSIAETLDGGYITVGNIDTSLNFGAIGLYKFGKNGKEEWKKTYSIDFTYVVGQSVLVSEDGGYRVVGNSGKVSYYGEEKPNILLFKTDPDGNI